MRWLCLVVLPSLLLSACPPPWAQDDEDAGPEPTKVDRSDGGAPRNPPGTTRDAGSVDAALACMDGPRKFRPPRRYGVVNGTRDPQHVPLSESQKRSVLALGFEGPTNASCSGVLIDERTVLTAQHCTEGNHPANTWAMFGPDDLHPVLSIRAVQKREHPSHDLALLELESSPSQHLDITPIPIALEELTQADIGIMVEQAGYGDTSADGNSDGRFFVVEPLVGFETDGNVLVVDGNGQRGVCFGDSGGPSMRITATGEVRVIGVLSWGDDSCVGRDRYARTDVVRAWIEEWTGPTPGSAAAPCGTLDLEGRCTPSGSHAIYCSDAGVMVEEACATGTHCAYDTTRSAWRCLDDDDDPCAGLSSYGACEGQTLHWCDRGVPAERPCGHCGEQCVLLDPMQGFNCVESACGDVTYLGRCDGTIAVWCNHEGQRRSTNCADDGQVCGWVDRDTGYYCLDQNDCGDLDYRGRCNGNVAEWCERGDIRRRDCASHGQVCNYVNDDVGYFCAAP